MPKPYETVVIVDAMIPDESISSEFDAISKLIESNGKLVKLDRWGKRKLAYEIRRKTHGEYAVFYYESEGAVPAELEKRFRINENILRWLTVADNPVGVPPDKKPEDEAAAQAEAAERAERGDRHERGGRFDRDRGDRFDRGDRGDRHERGERSERRDG